MNKKNSFCAEQACTVTGAHRDSQRLTEAHRTHRASHRLTEAHRHAVPGRLAESRTHRDSQGLTELHRASQRLTEARNAELACRVTDSQGLTDTRSDSQMLTGTQGLAD